VIVADGIRRTARFSDDDVFRYHLGRYWNAGDGILLMVMLNASTATGPVDDATIRRCMRFAMDGGFAGLEVVNLFAFRTAYPRELAAAGYPIGPENDIAIAGAVTRAREICVAWGVAPAAEARVQQVIPVLRWRDRTPKCLRITRSGWPGHPLYLPASCKLHDFTPEAIDRAMNPEGDAHD
jgi:hypothetical protein